jgi:hypothetical protein
MTRGYTIYERRSVVVFHEESLVFGMHSERSHRYLPIASIHFIVCNQEVIGESLLECVQVLNNIV